MQYLGNPATRGWLAGIIDGEGCLIISMQRPGTGGRVSPSHRTYLKVTMGHEPTVRRCQEITGVGSIHVQPGGQWNDAYSWLVAGREAASVVRGLRDLLITKAEEADVLLEFDALPRFIGGARILTPETIAARQSCFERIRDLKPSSRFRKAPA